MARGKPEKPFTKENAKEMGSKGGKARTGYKSLRVIMREIFESGAIDKTEFVKSQMEGAMEGNGSLAKLLWEYHDGKVTDKVELTGADGGPIETKVLNKAEYKKARESMIKDDNL